MKHLSRIVLCSTIVMLTFVSLGLSGETIPLRAGPVTMDFDAENVFLRYLRIGPYELLRGITAPVRDSHWATVAPKLSNLLVADHGDSFEVTFDVLCQEADIDFRWKGAITGTATGVIEYSFDGQAHSDFERNRIGFCVLHGPSAAGRPWVTETPDGITSPGEFPKAISPHQPAKNLRAITHEVAPGLKFRVDFEGDVFEMEDQRNWTDASFKTYCTPLEIPYPVAVSAGTKISQKIRLTPSGDIPALDGPGEPGTELTLGSDDRVFPLPRIGLQVSHEIDDLSEVQLDRLRALHLDHLRVDLPLSQGKFVDELRRATHQAKALNLSLIVGLNLGPSPDFAALLKEIADLHPPVVAWLVTSLNPSDLTSARQQLATVQGKAILGITEITNFVELNRKRPKVGSLEAIGFGINPQIHAFDNASIMETLPIHADVVDSARQFSGEIPLWIGPVTLAPQFVDGQDPPGGPPPGPLPTYVDIRQVEPFTAAWTLGSLKYLTQAGAASVTYYETIGWNGVMDAEDIGDRPAAFPSHPGQTYPVYDLLKAVGDFAGGEMQQIDCSDDLAAVGIDLYKSGRHCVLVGNLKNSPQTVTLIGFGGSAKMVKLLGRTETQVAAAIRINLPPYAVARIDPGAESNR